VRGCGVRADIRTREHLIFVAHLSWCAIESLVSVVHPGWCATEFLISVAHMVRCATEIVKPMIGAGRVWGPPYFCIACLAGAPQKYVISMVHLAWCAT
jgi:hypothetical protein